MESSGIQWRRLPIAVAPIAEVDSNSFHIYTIALTLTDIGLQYLEHQGLFEGSGGMAKETEAGAMKLVSVYNGTRKINIGTLESEWALCVSQDSSIQNHWFPPHKITHDCF